LTYDGKVKIWDNDNSPVFADGIPWWTISDNVVWAKYNDPVYLETDYVFLKEVDGSFWW
jgi:hypothetical protein